MKNSIDRSIPAPRRVRGYQIQRMPIGRFLSATRALSDLPMTLARALFPDADSALEELRTMTRADMETMAMRAFAVLPAEAVRIFAELSGIPEPDLLEDPNVGLDGLCEMTVAWLEVNGIENFIKTARTLTDKVRAVAGETTPGSNG